MKKLMLTMLSVVGMMLFVALPAKACTSYYVGKDCTKDGTTMYGRTEDYSPKKDKVYKVIQPKKVGKNATFKDETGATTFQAPIKVETTYRYTICRDSEGAEDGYFGEFGTNTKGVSMSATTSASVAEAVEKFDPYVDAYESKVGGITEENLADYVLCQASSAREGVELLADVIDTVGAGDGFALGVITALLEGKTLESAALRGNAVGAMQVQVLGDNEGYPTREKLLQFYEKQGVEEK